MIEGIEVKALKAPFSKGIVQDKGVHLMPEQYTPYAKNIRIKNATTTNRNGYSRVVEKAVYTETTTPEEEGADPVTTTVEVTDKYIDNMISDGTDLFALCDGKLYKVNFDNDKKMEKATGATFQSDTYMLKYWKYLFFLSENSAKGYSLDTTQIDPDDTSGGAALTVTDDAYFRFGDVYKQNVYLAGGKDKSNILYMSRAGSKASPTNILDFDGTGSDALYFKSKIMGLAATREQLFVFTEDSVEIISYSQSGSVLTMISVPIAGSNQPANPRMVVKTDDLVFFWTKDNQMKSLNYMQGVTDRVIGDVSHRPNLSINDFTDTLDEDQSTSFGYYDRSEKTIHWHLKQKGEPMPNVVLVYDINTDSFFIDTNKYYNCVAGHNNKYYAGSSFGTIIYQDNVGTTDDGEKIERQRKTALLSLGSPDYRKEFRIVNVYGEKEDNVDINVTVYVDGQTAFSGTIQGIGGGISGFASNETGSEMLGFDTQKGGLKPFEYVITRGNMRARGKNMQIKFEGNSYGDFCLSGIEVGYKQLNDNNLSDRAKSIL